MKAINLLINLLMFSLVLAILPGTNPAFAAYPSKPITWIVPYSPGGGGDTTSRFIADMASDIMGVKIIVQNKTGGGATIGIGYVSKSRPDGYTVGFVSTSPITIRPHLLKMPYHPLRNLTYLGQFVSTPLPIIVRSESPWKTLQQMIDFAKNNPGKLRWSTAVQKGGPHVAVNAMFKKAGARGTFIPSKGGAKALAALLGKTIDMAAVSDFAAPFAAGEVRILAETTPNRNPVAPNAPTLIEAGYPFAPTIFFGLAGPAGLSKEVIRKWDMVLEKVINSSRFRELARRLKATPKWASSADFTDTVWEDYEKAGKVLATLDM